ncbi:MAG: nucleoside:proton symporter [Rhodospirillum sp.]|nr:nucleoside:proton symporter [Rhodospirillum sp.]MCF8491511.1 nucleoside:proton symporter [Rhodospirillum sp.]MCF8502160.1 nucleoside:proton symporter [Rhodospirillum sp.]
MEIGQSLLGLGVFILFCWGISEGRGQVPWRAVGVGVVFQIALALLLLKVPPIQSFFVLLNDAVLALRDATKAGTSFVFGYLGGGDTPFDPPYPGADFILSFQALPILIVMSALSALLFYWGVLPFIVKLFSKALEKTLGVGGAVGVGAAANIFVGMVEAPLFVRPYIKSLSRSELFVVMTCGMATIAGTVMVIYATFLTGIVDNPLGQILTASLISAPAAIIVALIMVPGEQGTEGTFALPPPEAHNSMEAITIGTMQGVQLFINVVALLLVMVALVALVNSMLGVLPDIAGAPLTLERMLGWIMAPVCWLMGIPWAEAQTAGTLMGVKTILNEFIAYLNLSKLPEGSLSPRSSMILTYALCGFANMGSLGIMIGGLIAIAPERRKEIVALSGKSILSGTIATCMTGAVVGLLVW